MSLHLLRHTLPLIVLALPACQNRAPESAATDTAPTSGSVVRENIDPTPTPTVAPIQSAVIQTQPGPDGTQVALNKATVTGDILTVQLTYNGGTGSEWQVPSLNEVSIIDDATAQRIGVLKDGQGSFLASPINPAVKTVLGFFTGKGPQIVWFKFPAPPATSKTISINIPEVVPFDGVPVTRS